MDIQAEVNTPDLNSNIEIHKLKDDNKIKQLLKIFKF